MKTLAFAALAAALLVAPAFAAETTPNASSSTTQASATTLNPARHTFAVGERMPSGFASNKYIVYKPEELGLDKPTGGKRWYVVESNAYLLDPDTNTVEKVAPVKAK